jgi:hypothetical protein
MPVGGAPSRSGFLATPTDASPRSTFSENTQHPGRRDAVYALESDHSVKASAIERPRHSASRFEKKERSATQTGQA